MTSDKKETPDRPLRGGEVAPDDASLDAFEELLPDVAFFVVDAERHIVRWSRGAEKMLGFQAEEVLGEHCLKANRCRECMVGCGIAEHSSVKGTHLTLHTKRGNPVEVRKWARAYTDDQGRFSGGIEVLRAVSGVFHPSPGPGDRVVAEDHEMKKACERARVAIEQRCPVLVRGEPGSGKTTVAAALCRLAGVTQPTVVVQTEATSEQHLLRALFGSSESGATEGAFERATGGALVLEDALQPGEAVEAELERLLSKTDADRCVIVTTSVEQSGVLSDARWAELGGVAIDLPPLRRRSADLQPLIAHFLAAQAMPSARKRVSPELLRVMLKHPWPGNVSQLKGVLSYAIAAAEGPELTLHDTPAEFRASCSKGDGEAERIRAALAQADGHLGRAASSLGMSRATLWRKRKRHGI